MQILENPIKVMFIDYQIQRIDALWKELVKNFYEIYGNYPDGYFSLIKPTKFSSQEETIQDVLLQRPIIIFLGNGLGVPSPTGVQLAKELDRIQKQDDELNYFVFTNSDGDPSEFIPMGNVSICGRCDWNSLKGLSLILKVYNDIKTWGAGLDLKYAINLDQIKFVDSFYHENPKAQERYNVEQEIHNCLASDDLSNLGILIDHYIGTRINTRSQHGYWVHGLSHFDSKLWELNQFDSLKKLYGEAVLGAIETEDLNCLGRILYNFVKFYSSEKGSKDEYGLSLENLEKLKPINEFFRSKVSSLMGSYFGENVIEEISSM